MAQSPSTRSAGSLKRNTRMNAKTVTDTARRLIVDQIGAVRWIGPRS